MERIDKLEEKEKELETRLANLEIIERELRDKLKELEAQIKEFGGGGLKKKTIRKYIPSNFIKSETEKIDTKKITGAEVEFRRDLLEKQIKDVIQKYPKRYEEKQEDLKLIPEEKKRGILKKQIGEIIKKFETRKDYKSEEEIKEPVRELKIRTDKDVWDARLLFELLLKVGVIKSDNAEKELGVDRKTINDWARDLEKGGLIEIMQYPYGISELRLKDISVAIESKKKG